MASRTATSPTSSATPNRPTGIRSGRACGLEVPSSWPDGWEGCLGLEPTPDQYVAHLVEVFRRVRRVLRPDGCLWIQLGDSYVTDPGNGRGGEGNYGLGGGAPHRSAADKTGCGLPAKNLVGVPWRVALALQAEGWVLRSECIWEMSNALPEGARHRPARSHQHVFLLTRSGRYYFDAGTGPALRTVWRIPATPLRGHYAHFPPRLAERCARAGSLEGGVILDPFCGTGTTLAAARRLGRYAVGCDLNGEYAEMARPRIWKEGRGPDKAPPRPPGPTRRGG